MTLEELNRLESFALLGPGFTGAGFVLLTRLREADGPGPVSFLPYEGSAADLQSFCGDPTPIDVTLTPPDEALDVLLESSGHAAAVETIRQTIAAGDVYQVNYTLRALIREAAPLDVLRALCRRGVPRFAAWVRLPDGTEFISASPELFFEVEGRRIRCEPMKGTASPSELASLELSAKDCAELAMITDLIRNDLTPLCEPRSVKVR